MTNPGGCSRVSLARMIWFDGFAIQEVMEEKLALPAREC
jgi:hypothetical protein